MKPRKPEDKLQDIPSHHRRFGWGKWILFLLVIGIVLAVLSRCGREESGAVMEESIEEDVIEQPEEPQQTP